MGMFDDVNQKTLESIGLRPPQVGPMLAYNQSIADSAPGPSPFPLSPAVPLPTQAPPVMSKPVAVSTDDNDDTADDSDDSSVDKPKNPLADLLVTKEDLEKASKQKKDATRMGSIADAASNSQGWGNFFLGHMNPHVDASKPFDQQAAAADQPIKNKMMLLQQGMNVPQIEMKMQMSDANSPISQMASNAAVAYARENGLSPDDFKGKSFAEINTVAPGVMEKLGDQHAALAKARMVVGMMGQRLGMQQDNQTSHAGDVFDKDTMLKDLTVRKNQIGLDRHTLQTADVITPQMLAELGQGLGNALAGAKGAGFHQADLNTIKSSQTWLAANAQKIMNKPYNALSPDFRQYLDNTFDRLGQAYSNAAATRAEQLRGGRNYSHNQAANKALDDKTKSYTDQAKPAEGGDSSPPHGPTVVQDGHTYNWNPQTKKYE